MDDVIIARVKPLEPTQYVYVFLSTALETPIAIESDMNNLLSNMTMAAAKYKINKIKLSGAKDFNVGLKDQLTEKINTCFGKSNNFTIELM